MDEQRTVRCYACGAVAPADAFICGACLHPLSATRATTVAGIAYALNRLPELIEAGVLDAAGA